MMPGMHCPPVDDVGLETPRCRVVERTIPRLPNTKTYKPTSHLTSSTTYLPYYIYCTEGGFRIPKRLEIFVLGKT